MTREEAIQEFQNVKDLIRQDGKDWFDERDIPLLDMAIEALSADAEVKYSFIPMNDENLFEVVRCKDCKYQDKCEEVIWFDINDDEVMGHRVHWCSYGERREP